jgi:hypothetical protein
MKGKAERSFLLIRLLSKKTFDSFVVSTAQWSGDSNFEFVSFSTRKFSGCTGCDLGIEFSNYMKGKA